MFFLVSSRCLPCCCSWGCASPCCRSNFQFIWRWEEWAYVLDLLKWAPQRVFVQEVLDREVRLSYWDKVKQSIESTPALEELLPPKGVPDFGYSSQDDDKTEYTLSTELNVMVKGKKPARDVIIWLEESVIPVNGLDVALRVVVQTLLDIGSKSFTHLITVLERYGQVIGKLCTNEETQIALMAEVGSFWKNSAQSTAITVDRRKLTNWGRCRSKRCRISVYKCFCCKNLGFKSGKREREKKI